MTVVTLEGSIPVYVQIDTESMQVIYVNASDEEFAYSAIQPGDLPLAFTEDGDPIEDATLIERALAIADSDPKVVGDKIVNWPAWSWGW